MKKSFFVIVTYSGVTYSLPVFGVVGSNISSVSRTSYAKAIALDIVETSTLSTDNLNKVYEGRLQSRGSCSTVASVIDYLLNGLFKDFPGPGGKTINSEESVSGFQCSISR